MNSIRNDSGVKNDSKFGHFPFLDLLHFLFCSYCEIDSLTVTLKPLKGVRALYCQRY